MKYTVVSQNERNSDEEPEESKFNSLEEAKTHFLNKKDLGKITVVRETRLNKFGYESEFILSDDEVAGTTSRMSINTTNNVENTLSEKTITKTKLPWYIRLYNFFKNLF